MGAVNPTISGETETQVRLPASPGSPTPCDLEPIVAFAGPQFSCELKSFNSDSLRPSLSAPSAALAELSLSEFMYSLTC